MSRTQRYESLETPLRAEEALVIVAKYPKAGEVKTRLAQRIGASLACELYLGFLRDLEEKFAASRRSFFWAYTPAESDFPKLLNHRSQCFPQEGGNLGERLYNIFRRLMARGFRRVVVSSSDSPQVEMSWIEEAFAGLVRADVVLGPAEDGGYYLVGMRGTQDLFAHINMSTPQVFAETMEEAHRLGLSVHLLPSTFDVDRPEDLEKLESFLRRSEASGSLQHTRAVLNRLMGSRFKASR